MFVSVLTEVAIELGYPSMKPEVQVKYSDGKQGRFYSLSEVSLETSV